MRLSLPIVLALGPATSSAFTSQRLDWSQQQQTTTKSRIVSFKSAVSDESTASSGHKSVNGGGGLEDDGFLNGSSLDEQSNDIMIHKSKFSKAKWKKKRFLMVQDVKTLIQQNSPHAPKKAEEMVRRMKTLYEKSGESDVRPTLQTYNLWIHALAKSSKEDAGILAEQVLEEMHANNITPDVVTYTSIMDAHARSHNADRAEEVLFKLLEKSGENLGLSAITCDTILNAWAQQGTYESAKRAEMILFRLEEWQRDDIRPTKISYSTVMNAWAKVGSTEAAEHAEALLERMLKSNQVQPDAVVFNAAINAWATSKDEEAGKRALLLLRRMKEFAKNDSNCNPDIVTYNTVLSAWSNSGHVNAAPYTEKIVQEMENASEGSNAAPKPNTVTYNTVLNAWSKSKLPGSAPRAQKVLDYMIKSDRESISPDVISFGSVLDAWAKSKEPHKGAQCRDLLAQMLDMYGKTKSASLRPTPYTYNAVINACAFSAMGTSMEEQREALQIAVQTFSSMRQSETPPDTVTYGNMLKCLSNLMPEGDVRSNMAIQIFNKCIEDGLVGALTWNEVRRTVPASELAKTYRLKGHIASLQTRDLPRRWKKANRFDKNGPQAKRKSKEDVAYEPKPRPTIVETSVQSGKDL